MRGKTGYKRPVVWPAIKLTQFSTAVLTYAEPVFSPSLTQFSTAVLTYAAPVAQPRVAQFNVAILTYKSA